MTTDNRTSVQIVADALRSMPEAERDDDRDPAVVVAEYAVAALVAAQGAAPQADSEYEHLLKARALHQTNAGLPSSGVDEDALAEVIAKSRGFGNGWEQIPPLTRGAYREIARAVAEWLKGAV